jgi:Ribonuclease G/E
VDSAIDTANNLIDNPPALTTLLGLLMLVLIIAVVAFVADRVAAMRERNNDDRTLEKILAMYAESGRQQTQTLEAQRLQLAEMTRQATERDETLKSAVSILQGMHGDMQAYNAVSIRAVESVDDLVKAERDLHEMLTRRLTELDGKVRDVPTDMAYLKQTLREMLESLKAQERVVRQTLASLAVADDVREGTPREDTPPMLTKWADQPGIG